MIAVGFLWFFAMLTLSFAVITAVQANFPDTVVGRTFGVIF